MVKIKNFTLASKNLGGSCPPSSYITVFFINIFHVFQMSSIVRKLRIIANLMTIMRLYIIYIINYIYIYISH